MKAKLFTTLAILAISLALFAQAPQSFKYQAVARTTSGDLIVNQNVGIQISILQGSTSGTAVYVETHATTTNEFGLVNIQIGIGSVVSGTFNTIDWGANTYFVKVEVDESGGSNYSPLGTFQLLSVPYALHAKTVETDLVDDADADPTNEIELPTNAALGDMAYHDGTNWTKVDAPVGNNKLLTFCNGVPTWTDDGQCVINIGDLYGGGVVFYIFQSGDAGYVPGETHGLICSVSDQTTSSTPAEWGCFVVLGADGTAIGTGAQNTIDIEAGCATVGIAADLCANLSLNGYDDWFLPSKDELNQMYLNKATIDATSVANGGSILYNGTYWSSSETGWANAWNHNFNTGGQSQMNYKSYPAAVRAVRAF